LNRRGEGLFRAFSLAERRRRNAPLRVLTRASSLRSLRRAQRDCRRLRDTRRRHEGRVPDRSRRVLRRHEALKRLGVPPRSLKRDAKLGVRGSNPTVRLTRLIATAMMFAHGASRPRRNRLATSTVFFATLSEEHSRMQDAHGRPLGHEPAPWLGGAKPAALSRGERPVRRCGEAQAYRHYELGIACDRSRHSRPHRRPIRRGSRCALMCWGLKSIMFTLPRQRLAPLVPGLEDTFTRPVPQET
jgi:hypothetical protein